MSEIQIVVSIVFVLAVAYFVIYPKYAGNDIKKLAWMDAAVLALTLLALTPFNLNSDSNYTILFIDTHWWMFTIIAGGLIELPLFALYVKARGLGSQYRQMWSESFNFRSTASPASVEKQLSDTKWDGLRTPGALRFLVIGSNALILLGTVFLMFIGDSDWAAFSLLYIALLFIFWFLLRQAVRLIPDAPTEALDERLIQDRNQTYYSAYGLLSALTLCLGVALLGATIAFDIRETSDGFTYNFTLTWPQVQSLFWLIYGYAFMLPSMVLAWRQSNRLQQFNEIHSGK